MNRNGLGPRRGCLAAAGGWLALTLLAPAVALVRGWQAWRRGSEWIVRVRARPPDGRGRSRIEVEADIPLRSGSSFPTRLTDTVVRIAEALRRPDDVYHHLYRRSPDPEAVVQPVGPLVQELGERFSLALGRPELQDRTVVWLTVPAASAIAELVGPEPCEPETAGEPGGLVDRSGARWAMTARWLRVGPSTVYRVVLWVPEERAAAVRSTLERLERGP